MEHRNTPKEDIINSALSLRDQVLAGQHSFAVIAAGTSDVSTGHLYDYSHGLKPTSKVVPTEDLFTTLDRIAYEMKGARLDCSPRNGDGYVFFIEKPHQRSIGDRIVEFIFPKAGSRRRSR